MTVASAPQPHAHGFQQLHSHGEKLVRDLGALGLVQHLSERKPPLFPSLVPTSFTTAYRRVICLPTHWKMLHMEDQPHWWHYFCSP